MPKTPWTKKENELLRKHFPSGRWEDLLRIFKGRSRPAIYLRATRSLGLHRKNLGNMPYSDKEKEILKKHYSVVSPDKLMKMLPNRTWLAVKSFATNSLRLSRKQLCCWTPEELEALRKHYPNSSWTVLMGLFPNKTRSAISLQGMRLGMKRGERWFWSEQETKILLQAVKDSAKIRTQQQFNDLVGGVADKIGRTLGAIKVKIRALNLKWQCQISVVGAQLLLDDDVPSSMWRPQ